MFDEIFFPCPYINKFTKQIRQNDDCQKIKGDILNTMHLFDASNPKKNEFIYKSKIIWRAKRNKLEQVSCRYHIL